MNTGILNQSILKCFSVLTGILLLSLSIPTTTFADAEIQYLPNRENPRQVVMENDDVRYVLALDRGVRLAELIDKRSGIDLMAGNDPLAFVSVRQPWPFNDVGYDVLTLQEIEMEGHVGIITRHRSSYVENTFVVTQQFTLGDGVELGWTVDVKNNSMAGLNYREAQAVEGLIRFPLMQDIAIGPDEGRHYLIPTQERFFCIDSPDDFVFYFTRGTDPKMPIDVYSDETNTGIYFHMLYSVLEWDFEDKEEYVNHTFLLDQVPQDEARVMDARIAPHEGDWHEAFRVFKKYIRDNFDFTYYERPVQERYRQRFVSHFTFLYGRDIYDFEENRFRIDEFLDEGEANFGGYDYMLLWHDYPRMGIDDRDQFAMYEDLPGGLEGLREMVERAHLRDVQVFIPYKPWDIMRKGQNHFTEEARIAEAIGADGVFLDTMRDSDIAFRAALDAVNPENVFVSEGRPVLADAELVTGSWNQQGVATNKMPNVDLFRFIIPEHNVHNINRSARERRELILNALFNGTGFIVWEDIFGEINRYPWDERIMISRYNRIVHEHRDGYLTDNPEPLIPALHPDLFVNAFVSDEKAVYPAYVMRKSEGSLPSRMDPRRVLGPFLEVDHPEDWRYVDVWNHQPILSRRVADKTQLIMPEELADDMAVVVGMPANLRVLRQGDSLHVDVRHSLEESVIHINTVDNLTMMEEHRLELSGSGGSVSLSDLNLDFPYKVLVKLMQHGVAKDEVIVDVGWKQFDADSY